MNIEIYDPRQVELSDGDIRSFLAMMAAPDQTEWDYEEPAAQPRQPISQVEIESFRANFLPNPNNYAFWAKAKGEIVGMVGLNRHTASHNAHCAELGVGVAQAYQRQGLGYRLVSRSIDRARAIGLHRLEACCLAENFPVARLLQKAGFREEGIRRGAILKQGMLHDERQFGLLLG